MSLDRTGMGGSVLRSNQLSWEKAQEIRSIHGLKQKEIAAIFGVSQETISKVLLYKEYKNKPKSLEEKTAQRKLRRKTKEHGLSVEDIALLGDSCHICGEKSTGRWGTLHIDHDHYTGKVRGLLCVGCNRGIGFFGDSVDKMESAIRYIRNGGKRA